MTDTKRLISRARQGSVHDLQALFCFLMQHPEKFNIQMLEVALVHLVGDYEPNPRHLAVADQLHLDRAVACLTLVHFTCLGHVQSQSPQAREAGNLIRGTTDRIRRWVSAFLRLGVYTPTYHMDPGPDYRESYLRNADLLHDLLGLDEEVHKELASSTAFAELVLGVWIAKDSDGTLYMDVDYSRGRGCPMASFLRKFVDIEEGREALLQQLLSTRASSTLEFAKATVERVRLVRNAALAGADPHQVVRSLGSLWLTYQSLSEFNDYFYRSFSKANYVYEFCSTLDTVSKAFIEQGAVEDLFRRLMVLVSMVGTGGPDNLGLYNLKHAQDIVSAGFIGLLCRVTTSLPTSDDHPNGTGTVLLNMIGKYTTYTRVLDELMRAEFPASLGSLLIERVATWGGPFSVAWELFHTVLSERMKLPRSMTENFMLCDNPSCSETSHAEYKECSWCSSVVYCSPKCQREDWSEFHQYECDSARKERASRKASCSWYSQKQRSAHAAMAQSAYNGVSVGGDVLPFSPRYTSKRFVPVVDYTTLNVTLFDLDTEVDDLGSHLELDFPQEYLEPRMRSMLQEHISGEGLSRTRIASFWFAFSKTEIITLLAKLKKRENSEYFELKYCVARHGRSSLVPPVNLLYRETRIAKGTEPEEPLEINALRPT